MSLSIIIVNYRSATYIINAIQSAVEHHQSNSYEWIVVDNASGDDSKQLILSKFPFVNWIDMGYNAGFARANNEGIRQSTRDVVLLLNPDVVIKSNAIEDCYNRFINSNHVACGVQLLNIDGSSQISGSYFMKGGLNHLLPLPYWGSFLRWVAFLFNTEKPSIEKAIEEEPVDWISGAFLMVRKSVIKQAGMMDEDFFLYAEEVEWCSRLKKIGSLCIYGKLNIIHILGETIKDATQTNDKTYTNLFDKKGLQLIVSNHVRIRKQYGLTWFLFQLFNYSFAVFVFFLFSILYNLFHLKNPFNEWNKITGLAKNVLIVWMLTPTIINNKPHFYKVL